jgi:preprotein translocase subunit SecG
MENISTVVIVIHIMVVLALVVIVLLQRSEGGALGMGGGGGGGLMSARGAANALTRTTGILAAVFFITSLSLGVLAKFDNTNILDDIPTNQQAPAAPSGDTPLGTGSGGILNQLPKAKPQAPASGVPDSQ